MVRGNLPIMVSPLFSLAEPISIRPNVFGFSFYGESDNLGLHTIFLATDCLSTLQRR